MFAVVAAVKAAGVSRDIELQPYNRREAPRRPADLEADEDYPGTLTRCEMLLKLLPCENPAQRCLSGADHLPAVHTLRKRSHHDSRLARILMSITIELQKESKSDRSRRYIRGRTVP